MIEPKRMEIVKNYISGLVLLAVFAAIVGGAASFIYYGYSALVGKNERLMKECIADGHREYECQGIINGRNR